MAFRVIDEPTFTHEVKVQRPTDGGYTTETLKVTFRVLAAEEAASYDLGDSVGTAEFLRKVIVRLDDIVDENGKPLSYNDALRDRVIAAPYVRIAIARAYGAAMMGERLGN